MKATVLLSSADAETDALATELGAAHVLSVLLSERVTLERDLPEWRERVVAARYEGIEKLCHAAQGGTHNASDKLTQKLDDLLTHRIWGWLFFLGAMTLMFVSIFTIAQYPMDWIDQGFDKLSESVQAVMPPGDLRDLLTDGVLAGVGGVVIFLPQILILFFFIGLLEDTGYMARAAFLMDRVMSKVGLHGKSFIPLLSSYACAIPGIMSTRTIENPKDRLVTILVAPLMSCSARLPVYALMIAALWPIGTGSVFIKGALMMGLYLLAVSLPKEAFVGTAAWFFLLINLIKIPFSAQLGLIGGNSLVFNLLLIPFIVSGLFLGKKAVAALPQKSFDNLVLIFAGVAAARLLGVV
jgi:ferrous iron transport protein B